MTKIKTAMSGVFADVSAYLRRVLARKASEGDQALPAMIAPQFNYERPPFNYGKAVACAPKRGMFGSPTGYMKPKDPNRLFRGLAHMKAGARWAATQPWILYRNHMAWLALVKKMEKNRPGSTEGMTEKENIWIAHSKA